MTSCATPMNIPCGKCSGSRRTKSDTAGEVVDLDSDLPIKVRILDLGGVLKGAGGVRSNPSRWTPFPSRPSGRASRHALGPGPNPPRVKSLSSVFVRARRRWPRAPTPGGTRVMSCSAKINEFQHPLGITFPRWRPTSRSGDDNYLTSAFRGGGSTPGAPGARARLIEAINRPTST